MALTHQPSSNGLELMSPRQRNQSTVFCVLIIGWLFCSTSIVNGQAPSPENLSASQQQTVLRKFTFKHAKAADALKILQQLEPEQNSTEGIAVDERTNSLILRLEDDQQLRRFEEMCNLLDADTPVTPDSSKGISVSVPAIGPQSLPFDSSMGIMRGDSIESLKQQYSEIEQQTHQIADKFKQSKSTSESARSELQAVVRKSFEARQALQRAELADLAHRLQSMQQSIDMRDKVAEKVIARRVEDLLNPDLKWDDKQPNGWIASSEHTPTTGPSSALSPSLKGHDTYQTPHSSIEQAVWGLLAPHPTSSGNANQPKLVAFLGVDYRDRKEAIGFTTLIKEQITNYVSFSSGLMPSRCTLLSEEFVDAAMQESGLKLVELARDNPLHVGNRRKLLSHFRRRNLQVDSLLIASLDHLGESDKARDGEFHLTLEGYVDPQVNWFERAILSDKAPKTTEWSDPDLSTPQSTLDYLDRYSIAHPNEVPVECYTEGALRELSGAMLQQLSFLSGLSQIGLQSGGVIGVKDNVPMIAGSAPSFHLSVEALLEQHSLPTPPEECTKAFELLVKLTLGTARSSEESLVKPDRELYRLAAGILKSPKDFLPRAGELSKQFNETAGESDSPTKESKAQPFYLIEIDGDEATATELTDSGTSSIPLSHKLQRIGRRWLISEVFNEEILEQMNSSMSQVLGAMSAIDTAIANQADASDSKKMPDAKDVNSASPLEWNDFIKLLPEKGTALVMFSYEPEAREQMLPVAEKVADEAKAQLIELPLTQWRTIMSPEATHFVLMKDRQLVGTRTGLMTEKRLQDFVAKAKDWLTPHTTVIEKNSLVRIDCYINPGADNVGSQHGGPYPLTTAVVAVHQDQALLFGPESIAQYIEGGYSCVALVRDAEGKPKQLPLDILHQGPVKLLSLNKEAQTSPVSISFTSNDGTSSKVPLSGIENLYPKSATELLEAYDVGSAIFHIRGAEGLKPIKLAAMDDALTVGQRVLSGSFNRGQHVPPIHGFRAPMLWQSQTVRQAGGHVYGENRNGAEMFEVLCPTLPAPCGFTFNEHGRLIGRYGLGGANDKDLAHTVFKSDATHSVLHAALEKVEDADLKAALLRTLEESKAPESESNGR
jgi:hypothetical protein